MTSHTHTLTHIHTYINTHIHIYANSIVLYIKDGVYIANLISNTIYWQMTILYKLLVSCLLNEHNYEVFDAIKNISFWQLYWLFDNYIASLLGFIVESWMPENLERKYTYPVSEELFMYQCSVLGNDGHSLPGADVKENLMDFIHCCCYLKVRTLHFNINVHMSDMRIGHYGSKILNENKIFLQIQRTYQYHNIQTARERVRAWGNHHNFLLLKG